MSLSKKIFGYSLVAFSLFLIILIGMPQLYLGASAGKIEKEIVLKLDFLKEEKAKVVLLYFGYVGCENICTPAMTEIQTIYNETPNKNIAVYFVNLLDSTEKNLPQEFAKYFHKNFHGIYLNKKELQTLTNTINIAYTKSLTDKLDINHAGHLYLLVKNGAKYTQKFIYTTKPFNKKMIIKDIKNALN